MVTSAMGSLPLWVLPSLAPAPRACHPERLDEQAALQHEELRLGLEAAVAAVAAELAAAREHAVAGDEDRQRGAAASAADLLGHAAGVMGELPVAAGLAIGDADRQRVAAASAADL